MYLKRGKKEGKKKKKEQDGNRIFWTWSRKYICLTFRLVGTENEKEDERFSLREIHLGVLFLGLSIYMSPGEPFYPFLGWWCRNVMKKTLIWTNFRVLRLPCSSVLEGILCGVIFSDLGRFQCPLLLPLSPSFLKYRIRRRNPWKSKGTWSNLEGMPLWVRLAKENCVLIIEPCCPFRCLPNDTCCLFFSTKKREGARENRGWGRGRRGGEKEKKGKGFGKGQLCMPMSRKPNNATHRGSNQGFFCVYLFLLCTPTAPHSCIQILGVDEEEKKERKWKKGGWAEGEGSDNLRNKIDRGQRYIWIIKSTGMPNTHFL